MKFISRLRNWLRIHLCEHVFNSDNQIRIIKCEKCGVEYWIKEYKDLYKESRDQIRSLIKKK